MPKAIFYLLKGDYKTKTLNREYPKKNLQSLSSVLKTDSVSPVTAAKAFASHGRHEHYNPDYQGNSE